jgi:diguanylate cyclase (GGDEF)-like protein
MIENITGEGDIVTIRKNETLEAAAAKMLSNKVSCLVVNNDEGKFLGILTERDIVNAAASISSNLELITVEKTMTREIISCCLNTPTNEALSLMKENHIRHLPIVDQEVLVGIESIRDLMEKKLQEERTAAEEVAMLSSCLKSIDFNEVAQIVSNEMPKLFQAKQCLVVFHEKGLGSKEPLLAVGNNCCCSEECTNLLTEVLGNTKEEHGFSDDSIPEVCKERGAKGPRIVIPFNISGSEENIEGKKGSFHGHLCMCGLGAGIASNKELTFHKAKLTKEILNAHLTNARLYHDAQVTSMTDALTGAGSRRFLEARLEAEYARSRRHEHFLSVAILDLDRFKEINDALGHVFGDEVLKNFAAYITKQKRKSDILARYGGDEFVIIMPETKANDGLVLLERLQVSIHDRVIAKGQTVTFSCGLTELSADEFAALN